VGSTVTRKFQLVPGHFDSFGKYTAKCLIWSYSGQKDISNQKLSSLGRFPERISKKL